MRATYAQSLRNAIAGRKVVIALVAGMAMLFLGLYASPSRASAAPPAVQLRVLLVGSGPTDATTSAWVHTLMSEGVPFTEVDTVGDLGAETVTLPALTSGATGLFNAVVLADSPFWFAAGQLDSLYAYEAAYGIRQVDGYIWPAGLGLTDVTAGPLDGITAQLTAAGLANLPSLKGPVPFSAGTYGYPSRVQSGAPFTPWLLDSSGNVLAGVYQHPATDQQANVAELALTFDYSQYHLQWQLLAPGLIDWVTGGVHLGLYRNYFGEEVDDLFLSDNSWDSALQCTPSATDPVDINCPVADQGVDLADNPDVLMTAADVDHVVNWEKNSGMKLNFVFNGSAACTAPNSSAASNANCSGSTTIKGTTYTDPGLTIDSSSPDIAGLVNELLAQAGNFNWGNHTWSHLYLGGVNPQPLPVSPAQAGTSGFLAAGSYSYEVTAATAYGESEPSQPQSISVSDHGSVGLSWPDVTNGGGPSLSQEEAAYSGGSGFWGYNVYRQDPGSSSFGLIGSVPEDKTGASATYSFNDTGQTIPGGGPSSTAASPTATNPGMGFTAWVPATDIEQEIGQNDAFAATNHLPNYSPGTLVTGEHSGLENPNLAAALQATGVTTIAADASRQPQQYSFAYPDGTGSAQTAPRYPSNIYYNTSNWVDEINEYNTIYVQPGVTWTYNGQSETGRCENTSSTTCLTTPATEQSILTSETSIMLSHVLGNDPRVGYAHQSDLIGPATENGQDYGYILLSLIDNMQAQYSSWLNAPLTQMTDATAAEVLTEQAAWAANEANVTATESGGNITITNDGGQAVTVPVAAPAGSTVNGAAFGQPYGGTVSAWVTIGAGASETVNTPGTAVAPAITSASTTSFTAGAAGTFTVTSSGNPSSALTETGSLPAGVSFTDNQDGTASLSGTATVTGSYPLTITATNAAGTDSQSFTLVVQASRPAATSPASATSIVGQPFSFAVTTSGIPAPALTEGGQLPAGVSFTDNGDGTATISGTPATGTGGSYPFNITATNPAGSAAQSFSLINEEAAAITSTPSAAFTVGTAGTFTVTTAGYPAAAITASGALPKGLTLTDSGNGTATIAGTPATGTKGTYRVTIAATNPATNVSATQAFTLTVDAAVRATITSASSTSFLVGQRGTFTVTASGAPTPGLTETGSLPAGLTFVDNGNGTATLAGKSTAPGTYQLTMIATNVTNGITNRATQPFFLVIGTRPVITSAPTAGGTAGTRFNFTVTATGSPAPTFKSTDPLPAGLTLKTNGTITGTPTAAGADTIHVTATNQFGSDTQALTINVQPALVFISPAAATFHVGQPGSFAVTTNHASATIIEQGKLPKGVTFASGSTSPLAAGSNGNGTLSGTPAAGTKGQYNLKITATDGGLKVTQSFTLTVAA
jgi:hypothetical protein